MHSVLINTSDMIYIFDVNRGKWGRACSLLVTTSNDECALLEGMHGRVDACRLRNSEILLGYNAGICE